MVYFLKIVLLNCTKFSSTQRTPCSPSVHFQTQTVWSASFIKTKKLISKPRPTLLPLLHCLLSESTILIVISQAPRPGLQPLPPAMEGAVTRRLAPQGPLPRTLPFNTPLLCAWRAAEKLAARFLMQVTPSASLSPTLAHVALASPHPRLGGQGWPDDVMSRGPIMDLSDKSWQASTRTGGPCSPGTEVVLPSTKTNGCCVVKHVTRHRLVWRTSTCRHWDRFVDTWPERWEALLYTVIANWGSGPRCEVWTDGLESANYQEDAEETMRRCWRVCIVCSGTFVR